MTPPQASEAAVGGWAAMGCAECGAPLDGTEDFDDVCRECDSLDDDYDLDELLDENE